MFKKKIIKIIQFEYRGCNINSRIFLNDFFKYLSKFDYKIGKIYPNNVKFYDNYNQNLENFKHSNWIAKL